MNLKDKIYVAGHNGMVGSAIVRKLREKGFISIITRSSSELDLVNHQPNVYIAFIMVSIYKATYSVF